MILNRKRSEITLYRRKRQCPRDYIISDGAGVDAAVSFSTVRQARCGVLNSFDRIINM